MSPFFLQSFYGLFLLSFRTQPDVLQNARSTYHLIYSVTLDYSDRLVFRLLTWAPEEAANPFCNWVHFISPFNELFNDHKLPLLPHWANHMFQYIVEGSVAPLATELPLLWENLTFKERISFEIIYTKIRTICLTSKSLKKDFLSDTTEYSLPVPLMFEHLSSGMDTTQKTCSV